MSNPLPWFPFHAQDWLSDPDVSCSPNAVLGGYLNLLAYQWQDGRLPKTDAQLQKLARSSDSEWSECRDQILRFFIKDSDGFLYNVRLDFERKKSIKTSKSQRDKVLKRYHGKAAVLPRGYPLQPQSHPQKRVIGSSEVEKEVSPLPTPPHPRVNYSEPTARPASHSDEGTGPTEATDYRTHRAVGPKTQERPYTFATDERKNLMARYLDSDPTGILEREDQDCFEQCTKIVWRGWSDKRVVTELKYLHQFDAGQVVWAGGDFMAREKHKRGGNLGGLFRLCVESDDGGFQSRMQKREVADESKKQERRSRETRGSAIRRDPGNGKGPESIGKKGVVRDVLSVLGVPGDGELHAHESDFAGDEPW